MTKYQKCYKEMFEANKELFTAFQEIHDNYLSDDAGWQKQFNTQGEKVLSVIRDYERRLCLEMNRGQYSKYSSNLADKFWEEVRRHFPKIDFVGVE